MTDDLASRESLYARVDELTASRETRYVHSDASTPRCAEGGTWTAHAALLDRLAANRRAAEACGWTSCAIERAGDMGRLSVWGVPPGEVERRPIPDWTPGAP